MATTKELLEKAILRLGSRGSRGGNFSTVQFSIDQDSEEDQSLVAPEDGHVLAYGLASAWSFCQIILNGRCGYTIQPSAGSGVVSMAWIPVSKGETFKVGFTKLTYRTVEFHKSVGGGLGFLRKLLGVVEVNYGYA